MSSWFIILFILDGPLPSFEDVECLSPEANLCIRVYITPELSELIVLTKKSDTIYNGYLGDIENDIFVVMIDEPEDNSRFVRIFTTHCNITLIYIYIY